MTLTISAAAHLPDGGYLDRIRILSDDRSVWKVEYAKKNLSVCSKPTGAACIKIFKLQSIFTDISAELLFDTLMDSDYRSSWDSHMLDGYEVCRINANNDVGYYAVRSFTGLRNRDFVLQRSWLTTPSEYIIFSRSVSLKSLPPRSEYIRGLVHLTAYLIRSRGPAACELIYINHCDPRGKLPTWVVNKATQLVAPKTIKRLLIACHNYTSWKRLHRPEYKPWRFPEQNILPSINWNDVPDASDTEISGDVVLDETNAMDSGIDETRQ